MDFSGVLQSVLAITTILAASFGGLQRANVQNLRDANKDLRDRAGDLEKERDEAEAKAKRLESDLEALGRVVSNEVQIAAFGERLEHHHEEAKGYWRASTEQGQQIIDALKRLSGGTGG